VEELSPVKRKLTIEVEAEEIDKRLNKALREIGKKTRIPGFRPGKAPIGILERYFGRQIKEEVARDLIGETLPKAFEDTDLAPLAFPELESGALERGKAFKYSAVLEVRPKIELGDYLGVEIEKEEASVTDEEVNERIEQILKAHGKLEPLSEPRPIKEGDFAILDYKAFEGDNPLEGIQATNFLVNVGAGDFHLDFEKALVGLKVGDEKEITAKFEEDHYHKALAGKEVRFQVKVIDIKEMKLPELTDDFAKQLDSELESVDDLKNKVREIIEKEKKAKIDKEAQKRLLTEITKDLDIDLPETLVESELAKAIDTVSQNLARSGSSLEKAGLSVEKLREELRPSAEERVKNMLVLTEIAQREGITVSDEDVEEAFKEMAASMGQDPQVIRRYYEAKQLMEPFRERLLEEKALNYLMEHANIKVKTATENSRFRDDRERE